LSRTNGSPILRAELDIIDAHAHAFPDSVAAHAMGSLCNQSLWQQMRNHHDGTLAGLLTSMDAAGIRRAILCSVATKPTQVEKITNWSVQVASDRIIPFASIHPDYEHPEREVERIAGGVGQQHSRVVEVAFRPPRSIRRRERPGVARQRRVQRQLRRQNCAKLCGRLCGYLHWIRRVRGEIPPRDYRYTCSQFGGDERSANRVSCPICNCQAVILYWFRL